MGAIQSSADLKIERLFYPSLTGSFLFYLIIFYFANGYYTLNAYFYFPNWRQEGGLSGWGVGWEDLEGVKGEETIISIYYVRGKNLFFNKRKIKAKRKIFHIKSFHGDTVTDSAKFLPFPLHT